MLGSGAKAAKPSFVSYISPEVRGRRVGAAGRQGWRGGGGSRGAAAVPAARRVVPLPAPVLPPGFCAVRGAEASAAITCAGAGGTRRPAEGRALRRRTARAALGAVPWDLPSSPLLWHRFVFITRSGAAGKPGYVSSAAPC